MAWASGWCAIRGARPNTIGSGEPTAQVGTAEVNGWLLLLDEGMAVAGSSATLAELSLGAEVVCLAVEKHVNSSHAAAWRGGRLQWAVRYEAARVVPAWLPLAAQRYDLDTSDIDQDDPESSEAYE